MPIQYGVHQDGDSFSIAPQLVNGDGKLNIGEVVINIGANANDDVLSTPHLQVTAEGAAVGKVVKAADANGNVTFADEQKVTPYAAREIEVTYTYAATETDEPKNITFSENVATFESDAAPIEGTVHVYLKTDNNVTEEVPNSDFSVSTEAGITTITMNSTPKSNTAVAVYKINTNKTAVEKVVPVSSRVKLIHSNIVGITSVTDGAAPNPNSYEQNTDWYEAPNHELILVPGGAIIGYNAGENFLVLDQNGDIGRKGIAEPWELCETEAGESVYLTYEYEESFEDEAITPTVGEGVATFTPDNVDANTTAIRGITFSSSIPEDDQNGFTVDPETFEITLHGSAAAEGEGWPTINYSVEERVEREARTVASADGERYIKIADIDSKNYHFVEIFSAASEGQRYSAGQAYEAYAYTPEGEEDPTEYRARFFDGPVRNMVPAYDNDGNAYWKNAAMLIDGDMRDGNVVVVNNGRLEYSDTAAVVELKKLLPDNPQEGQILKWNPQTDDVEWASDNDSWSAVAATAEPGLILGTDTNGDILFSNSFTVGEFSIATSDSLTGNGNINFNAGGAISFESVESFNVEASGNVNISTASAEVGSNESAQSINLTAGRGDGSGANGTITFELPDPNALRLKLPKLNGAALTSADANTGLVLTVIRVDNEGVAQLGWAYCNDLIMLRPAT